MEKSEGHLTIGNYTHLPNKQGQPYPQTYLPNPKDSRSGEAWFVDTADDHIVPHASQGDAGRFTLVHELGHALGMSHPSQYDVSSGPAKSGYFEDSESHTVMSYFGVDEGYMDHGSTRASAPQLISRTNRSASKAGLSRMSAASRAMSRLPVA